jgi:hypothetical protein
MAQLETARYESQAVRGRTEANAVLGTRMSTRVVPRAGAVVTVRVGM